MRSEPTTIEKGTAQTSSKGEYEFQSCAGHDSSTMNLSIIQNQCWDSKQITQRRLGIEAMPLIHEIRMDAASRTRLGDVMRRLDYNSVPNHSGDSHRRTIGVWQFVGQFLQRRQESIDRQRIGSGDAMRLDSDGPYLVKYRGFDTGSAAVDGQGKTHLHSLTDESAVVTLHTRYPRASYERADSSRLASLASRALYSANSS